MAAAAAAVADIERLSSALGAQLADAPLKNADNITPERVHVAGVYARLAGADARQMAEKMREIVAEVR